MTKKEKREELKKTKIKERVGYMGTSEHIRLTEELLENIAKHGIIEMDSDLVKTFKHNLKDLKERERKEIEEKVKEREDLIDDILGDTE